MIVALSFFFSLLDKKILSLYFSEILRAGNSLKRFQMIPSSEKATEGKTIEFDNKAKRILMIEDRKFIKKEMGKTPSFCLQIQQNVQKFKMLQTNYSA
jgi:hypothetical protein